MRRDRAASPFYVRYGAHRRALPEPHVLARHRRFGQALRARPNGPIRPTGLWTDDAILRLRTMSGERIDRAHRQLAAGFAIHEAVLSPDECRSLRHGLEHLVPHGRHAGIRHLLRRRLAGELVRALASDPRLTGIATAALDRRAVPFRATLFAKTGQANWLVGWHQDTALPFEATNDRADFGPWSIKDGVHYAHAPAWALERVLALRVHVDPSTADNGPLRVIPQTHTLGVLGDAGVSAIVQTRAGEQVALTIGLGGVIAMRPLLLHASSKCARVLPRRVLHIEYADSLDLAPGCRLACC